MVVERTAAGCRYELQWKLHAYRSCTGRPCSIIAWQKTCLLNALGWWCSSRRPAEASLLLQKLWTAVSGLGNVWCESQFAVSFYRKTCCTALERAHSSPKMSHATVKSTAMPKADCVEIPAMSFFCALGDSVQWWTSHVSANFTNLGTVSKKCWLEKTRPGGFYMCAGKSFYFVGLDELLWSLQKATFEYRCTLRLERCPLENCCRVRYWCRPSTSGTSMPARICWGCVRPSVSIFSKYARYSARSERDCQYPTILLSSWPWVQLLGFSMCSMLPAQSWHGTSVIWGRCATISTVV